MPRRGAQSPAAVRTDQTAGMCQLACARVDGMSICVYASWPRLPFVTEQKGRPAIAAEVRAAIRAGDYRPGHQLPSARVLAERFGVARGTIGAAMDQLVREGLVESR
ncbi:winged helix-turn-helix domain-containing protein, partial [Streptomyces sp. NPDC048558]|uniref:winged helix-turn-helix domain-containing protein n=1 Tax=Streptomyces sp. NPDC048558 TaxID=3155759 RepID=UPI0034238E04